MIGMNEEEGDDALAVGTQGNLAGIRGLGGKSQPLFGEEKHFA